MKTLYITGCNGFIGSRMMQYFSKFPEYIVYGIQRGNNERVNNIIYCDYENVNYLKNIIRENCIVIHTASFIPKVENDNKETEIINTNLVDFVIAVFKSKEIENLFNLSSISVYGYGKKDLVNITEDAEIILPSYYAKAKYKSEILLSNNFQRTYNLRISSPFGKDKKNKALLDVLIEKILNNEEVIIYGEGKRKQDFIWIEDICRTIEIIIKKNCIPGDYNLCTGTPLSVKEIIYKLEYITKKKANITSINKTEAPSVTISNEKLLKIMDSDKRFFTPFEQAIKELIW